MLTHGAKRGLNTVSNIKNARNLNNNKKNSKKLKNTSKHGFKSTISPLVNHNSPSNHNIPIIDHQSAQNTLNNEQNPKNSQKIPQKRPTTFPHSPITFHNTQILLNEAPHHSIKSKKLYAVENVEGIDRIEGRIEDREDPTNKKLLWLNERLHAPPPAKIKDEDLDQKIPNLNLEPNLGQFFSTKPHLYHFDEEKLSLDSSSAQHHSHIPQSRLESLKRDQFRKNENTDENIDHDVVNGEFEPSDGEERSESVFKKFKQIAKNLVPPNEPDLSPEIDNSTNKTHRSDSSNNNQPIEDNTHDSTHTSIHNSQHKSNPSKIDSMYRYENEDDSFLYDSIDPYADRQKQRQNRENSMENVTQYKQQSREIRQADLEETREKGEIISQAVDMEPIHNEIANQMLSRQSLSAYIMSKRAEILPPQARPVFWHGVLPYAESQGSLIPGLPSLQQESPDLDWRTFLDLSQPHLWYPAARLLKRKIVFHNGPTNSGKTHRAMLRLKEAQSGLYCGPLRLLAWENYEKLNSQGIPCSLLTGQEVMDVPKSRHVSSTVEMVSLDNIIDVAVIDEIQMIQDPDRGFAWTRALLGIPAKEVHLCGDATALEWLKELTAMTGEELHVCEYKRLSPLRIEDEPLVGYQNLKKGDCVVAFSRNDVYSLKRKIEEFTGKKCAIIYGNLPPDIRKQQAKYFNEGELDILVASDAIGMGINLNIGRVVFSSIVKFDGNEFRRLKQTEVLQIAGRAGRFNTQYHTGLVNVLHVPEDLEYIREQFRNPLPLMKTAQLLPSTEHLLSFCEKYPGIKFSNYLDALPQRAKVSKLFTIADPSTLSSIAKVLDDMIMPAYNRVMLCYMPISLTRFKSHQPLLEEFAKELANSDRSIPIPKISYVARPMMPQSPSEVALLEETFSNLEAYIWLWYRMGDQLYMHKQAKIDRESCQKIILHYLEHS
jgi:ATP-dependent RNA helicase SUPV3L1/SUV3